MEKLNKIDLFRVIGRGTETVDRNSTKTVVTIPNTPPATTNTEPGSFASNENEDGDTGNIPIIPPIKRP